MVDDFRSRGGSPWGSPPGGDVMEKAQFRHISILIQLSTSQRKQVLMPFILAMDFCQKILSLPNCVKKIILLS